MLCRPWVELLALIGIQAFPVKGRRSRGSFATVYGGWFHCRLRLSRSGGHGPTVYSTDLYRSATAKAGSNTLLCVAVPV